MSLKFEDLKADLDTAIANRAHHNKEAHEAEGMIKLLQGQIALTLKRQQEADALTQAPVDNGTTPDNLQPTIEESNKELAEPLAEVSNG